MARMSRVNQLKNNARREEQRENWSQAIELYAQALDASRKDGEAFADLSLYNRIGDIYLRIGQKNTAVRYYEQAIERYAEQDLHTSAIALCNKVLRIIPDRSTVFLQLGRLHIETNLVAEARGHYHRYASAMRERGTLFAGLEGLEELIARTGDPKTASLWVSFLLQLPDRESALARVEASRALLERHGIDPEDLVEQVRRGEAREPVSESTLEVQTDPLAGAFLSIPDDEPSHEQALPVSHADIAEADGSDRAHEPGVSTGDPVGDDAIEHEAIEHDDMELPLPVDALDGGDEPIDDPSEIDGSVEPSAPLVLGSIQWEDEVEEILAEFDRDLAGAFGAYGVEGPDPDLRPTRTDRRSPRPARETDEGEDTPAVAPTARRVRPLDDLEAEEEASRYVAATHLGPEPEVDSDDGDTEPDDPISRMAGPGVEGVEPRVVSTRSLTLSRSELEAFETDVAAADPVQADPLVDGEAPESWSPLVPTEPPVDREALESWSPLVPAEQSMEVDAAEPRTDGVTVIDLAVFPPEPSLVHDEVPEPEAAEPVEADAVAAVDEREDIDLSALEPGDVDDGVATPALPVAEDQEVDEGSDFDDSWLPEPFEAVVEAPETPAATAARPEIPAPESATPVAAALEAETLTLETPIARPRSPAIGDENADDKSAGLPEPVLDEEEPQPLVPTEIARLEPPGAARKEAVDREIEADDEMSGAFAETRLTIEDHEDAFVDWVRSASTGVLKRALTELESRAEIEKALLVIGRLCELVDEVELKAKQVEYLEKLGRTQPAIEACLALALSLEAAGQLPEARKAYAKVLRLSPGDERASGALADLGDVAPSTPAVEAARSGPKPYMPDHAHTTDLPTFLDDQMPSRVTALEPPGLGGSLQPYSGVAGGAEAGADFEQLLSEFRAELHEKPRKNGSGRRTELGASLKEMGRLDDAIRELQAAVREPSAPPLAFELLGEAFLEKGQARVAARLLERALSSFSNGDREILGVLYQLGMAYETMADPQRAVVCYERIFSVDIDYRDIQERILSCG